MGSFCGYPKCSSFGEILDPHLSDGKNAEALGKDEA